jgi:hypothetical protein
MTARKTTAPVEKPRFQVVDEKFIAQLSEGGEIRVPIRLKTKLVREVMIGDKDEMEQFFELLDGIGDAETADKLDELDIIETLEIVAEFFKAFGEKAKATPGESVRS